MYVFYQLIPCNNVEQTTRARARLMLPLLKRVRRARVVCSSNNVVQTHAARSRALSIAPCLGLSTLACV